MTRMRPGLILGNNMTNKPLLAISMKHICLVAWFGFLDLFNTYKPMQC